MKVLHTIRETPHNPTGLIALSISNENCFLAFPGSIQMGEVQIFDTINLVGTGGSLWSVCLMTVIFYFETGVTCLVYTTMPGAFSALRLYLWWSYVPSIYSHARCIFYFEAVLLVELCTLYLLPCQVNFLLWGCTSDGVLYLVFTSMPGAFSTLRLYLWWSYVPCVYSHARCIFYFEVVPLVELCTLCLLACWVRVTVCISGLHCCVCVTLFQH